MQKKYGEVCIVNLLSQSKKSESKLIQCFETIVRSMHSTSLKYAYYDLNQTSTLDKARGTNFFVENNLGQILESQKFHCLYMDEEKKVRELKERQRGIFRVNCLDCIERTGILQTKISALQLSYSLKHIGINLFEKGNGVSELDFFEDTSDPLASLLKNIWGSNADFLS